MNFFYHTSGTRLITGAAWYILQLMEHTEMHDSIVGRQIISHRYMVVYPYALLFIMKKRLHAGVINDNHASAPLMLITFTEAGQCE